MTEQQTNRSNSSTQAFMSGSDVRTSLDRVSLVDQVEKLLFSEIVSGKLRQGERINEAELARTLGASRNPVREAIRKLEERGLIVSVAHKGPFVRHFAHEDVHDIYAFRSLIECAAVRAALPRMSEEHFEEFSAIAQRMVEAARTDDSGKLAENDVALHHRICELSGSPRLLKAFEDIYAEVRMLITVVERRYATLDDAAADHRTLVDALRTRDVEKAAVAMATHIEDAKRRVAGLY